VAENDQILASTLQERGVKITTGGTDTHLLVIDFTPQNKTGKEMQQLFEDIGVTANKNTVPNDTRSPFITSGVRLGTPALTTRGFNAPAMKTLAHILADAILLENPPLAELKARIHALGEQFPLYPEWSDASSTPGSFERVSVAQPPSEVTC
jgi:glycine hydroxymethyltransferase